MKPVIDFLFSLDNFINYISIICSWILRMTNEQTAFQQLCRCRGGDSVVVILSLCITILILLLHYYTMELLKIQIMSQIDKMEKLRRMLQQQHTFFFLSLMRCFLPRGAISAADPIPYRKSYCSISTMIPSIFFHGHGDELLICQMLLWYLQFFFFHTKNVASSIFRVAKQWPYCWRKRGWRWHTQVLSISCSGR